MAVGCKEKLCYGRPGFIYLFASTKLRKYLAKTLFSLSRCFCNALDTFGSKVKSLAYTVGCQVTNQ